MKITMREMADGAQEIIDRRIILGKATYSRSLGAYR